MNDLFKYIIDGIAIKKIPNGGYIVFTIPTQHFKISSLEELIPDTFDKAIEKQKEMQELESEIIKLMSENEFLKLQ